MWSALPLYEFTKESTHLEVEWIVYCVHVWYKQLPSTVHSLIVNMLMCSDPSRDQHQALHKNCILKTCLL
jgi:hypothetical protein